MLAVLDATTVARLQALVAMAAPVVAPVAVSERQALMLEGIAAMSAATAEEKKAKKVLSPEHLAKMKAGREAAALKKQLEAVPAAEVVAHISEPALEANVVAALSAAPLAPAVAAPAKVSSKKGQPTAWADWVKKTLAENKDEIAAYKQAAEKKAGASLKWVSEKKGKTSPEWQAFKQEWVTAHPQQVQKSHQSTSLASSDDEEVTAPMAAPMAALMAAPVPVKNRGPKPMVEMTQEDFKAFLAEKNTLNAPVAEAEADTEPESDNEPVVTPPVKKRGPKPLASMTPAERAAHDAKVAERKLAKEAKVRAAVSQMQSVGGANTVSAH